MTEKQDLLNFCDRVNLVLLLDHGGRAGSNFFQCLFDQHQQLVTCPLVHYVYSYWGRFFGDSAYVSKVDAWDFIAEKSYFRFLYQDPTGECADTITKIGGDIEAPFDREHYRALIDQFFSGDGQVSRRDAILYAYAAYAYCRGFDLSNARYIMINDAVSQRGENMLTGFSCSLIDQACADFPNMVTLALLRDPRAQYASTRHQMVNELGNNYNLHKGTWPQSLIRMWRDEVSLDEGPAHMCLLYQVAAYRDLLRKWQENGKNWLFLRNEDFNTAFVPTMQELCAALSIDPDPAWIRLGDAYTATMMGRPWGGTGAYSDRYQKITNGPLENDPPKTVAVGPNRHVTERWKEKLSPHEQALLERYFVYEIAFSGYPFLQPDIEKKGFRLWVNQWRPWSGELPGWRWILKAENLQDKRGRLSYLFMVWPFYMLGRIKISLYERQGFFNRGFRDISQPPVFVGGREKPIIPSTGILIRNYHYVADAPNIRLVIRTMAHYFCRHKVAITLAEMDKDNPFVRLLSVFSDVKECPSDLGDYLNSQGVHLFYDREKLLLSMHKNYAAYFSSTASDEIIHEVRKEDVEAFLSRYITDQFGSLFSRQLLLSHFLLNSDRKIDRVFLKRTPEAHFFSHLLKGHNVDFYCPAALWAADLKNISRLFLRMSQAFFRPVPELTRSSPGKLGVQYVGGISGSLYPGDFDWLPDSGLDPAEIVYLVEGGDKPDEDSLLFCHKQKIQISYNRQFKPIWRVESVRRDLLSAFQRTSILLLKGQIKLAGAVAYYGVFRAQWRQFFKQKGIIAYLNVSDTNLDALPKMHALESIGGVDLSYEFSATGYHSFMDSRPLGQYQYICWGPLTQKMIDDCAAAVPYPLKPRHVFQAGNMRLYMKDRVSAEGKELLHSLKMIPGGKKRILVMDSATTHLKFLSVRAVQNFYDAIMALIERHPEDVYILKPQRPLSLRSEQKEKLDELIESGQIIIAPWKGLPHYIFPHVDMVISMPIYASSLMEAAAANVPVICFDQTNWPHVMREELPDFCLAHDTDELIKKVTHMLSGELSFKEKERLAVFQKKIDPYGDGSGHQRFADLIRLWAQFLISEGSAEKALTHVEYEYDKLWPSGQCTPKREAS